MKRKLACLLSLLVVLFHSCIPVRSIWLGHPNARDMDRFDHRVVHAGADCFAFKSAHTAAHSLKVTDWTTDLPVFLPLDSFLSGHKVRSLLVIQRDTIKFEYHRDEFSPEDLHPSYSIAKSMMSALIGIAIDEGYISGEQTLVTDILPELKMQPEAAKLTIAHLLNQTSGIRYSLEQDAVIYYGRDASKALSRIRFAAAPGQHQQYLNINYALLGLILQRATGVFPAQYLEDKIWKPIGMCQDAWWSVDEKTQAEKTFCCIGATARDFAKFGRLYLHGGQWEGKQVISQRWYAQTIRRDTTQGSAFHHNYGWHIGLKEYGDFMAIGLYKQHIYIHPEKQLIIVALNDREQSLKAERVNWWFIFRQIVDQL